jgi:hypothetical protein
MDNMGIGREQGRLAAYALALRALLSAHHGKVAERLMAHCPRHFAIKLREYSVVACHPRSSYVVRERLRRRIDPVTEQANEDELRPLIGLLNMWCREGRRSAVREVLGALAQDDLKSLASEPALDQELATLIPEFTEGEPPGGHAPGM